MSITASSIREFFSSKVPDFIAQASPLQQRTALVALAVLAVFAFVMMYKCFSKATHLPGSHPLPLPQPNPTRETTLPPLDVPQEEFGLTDQQIEDFARVIDDGVFQNTGLTNYH